MSAVELAVVRHYQVRVPAHHEAVGGDAFALERVELVQEDARIDHDPVSDDRRYVFVEDPTRHELESEGLAVHDHRMTGVVTALVADDEVHLFGDEVGELALTLVTPLRADHDRCRHAQPLQLGPG